MNYDNEYIGFETIIPNEVIEVLNQHNFTEQYLSDYDAQDKSLDEYEIAMSS